MKLNDDQDELGEVTKFPCFSLLSELTAESLKP
jgi:hypothetical protein